MTALAALIAAAGVAAGGVVEVPAGAYGDAELLRVSGLTLRFQPGAVLRSLNASQCRDLVLDGLAVDWTARDAGAAKETVVRVAASQGVEIRRPRLVGRPVPADIVGVRRADETPPPPMNSLIAGLYAGRAVSFEFCEDVALLDGEITGFFSGVAFGNGRNVRIARNHIHDLRTTPIKGGGQGIVIDRNHLTHMTPWRYFDPARDRMMGDHLDFIHIWTKDGGPRVDVEIVDNLLDAGEGFDAIGILTEDRFGVGIDARIARNTILTAENQGITLAATAAANVTDNVLLGPPGAEKPPTIVVKPRADVVLAGNEAAERSTKPTLASLYPDNTWRPRTAATAEEIATARADGLARLGWGTTPDPRDERIAELEAEAAELAARLAEAEAATEAGVRRLAEVLAERDALALRVEAARAALA